VSAPERAGQPSTAFHHLLRALAPATPSPVRTQPAEATWGWRLTLDRHALSVTPVWLTATDEGLQAVDAEVMDWSTGQFEPMPDAGWSAADLYAVTAGQPSAPVPLKTAAQMQALVASLARHPAFLEHPDRRTFSWWKPVKVAAPLAVDLAWEATTEGGLRLALTPAPQPNEDWLIVGEQAWCLTGRQDETPTVSLAPLAAPQGALLWALRHGTLSAADVQLWASRFAEDPRLAAFPLPAFCKPEVIADTPVLVARVMAKGDERTGGLGMTLSVAYGEHEMPLRGADVETLVRADGTTAIVKRNRSIERRTLNAMEASGVRVWPHPFSKRDAFPLGWSVAWLEHQDKTWLSPEPPPSHLTGWFALAQKLEAMGMRVEWDAHLPFARAQSEQRWTAHVEAAPDSAGAWFNAGIGVDVDGEQVDLTAALLALLNDADFPMEATEGEDPHAVWMLRLPLANAHQRPVFLDVPLGRLRSLLAPLRHAERAGKHRVRLPTAAMGEMNSWPTALAVHADLQTLWDKVKEARSFDSTAIKGLKATLRPYQVEGVAWLRFLADMGWGGVLADDMGLGKTLQLLAHLLDLKARKRLEKPALVVVPTTLLANWANEAAKFAPTLKVVTLHGTKRDHALALKANLILTTYGTLARDAETLADVDFSLIACDEAQNLRNDRTQIGQAVRKLKADRFLNMTGTPLENHLGELWAQVDLVMPGLLGSKEAFRTRFRTPIEKRNDPVAAGRLRALLAPFFLRRLKADVVHDLPAKTETTVHLEMGAEQRRFYETLRATQALQVRAAVEAKGLGGASLTVLNALLAMRQACCAPDLVDGGEHVESVKRQYVIDRVGDLLDEGRKILIFSSFTEVLDRLAADLTAQGRTFEMLTGNTAATQRGPKVARFQEGEVSLFLISLKAGGVGLNLTAADTVIHFDPWWNPAAESQATDRAHRIGQDKPVFVYRLICDQSVEDYILAMQARKSGLTDAVLDGIGGGLKGLEQADLDALFGTAA
jgi:superfamily II DNA or RNA helicase